jgi:hypothetical protein
VITSALPTIQPEQSVTRVMTIALQPTNYFGIIYLTTRAEVGDAL